MSQLQQGFHFCTIVLSWRVTPPAALSSTAIPCAWSRSRVVAEDQRAYIHGAPTGGGAMRRCRDVTALTG
jgi:hypothetical protein